MRKTFFAVVLATAVSVALLCVGCNDSGVGKVNGEAEAFLGRFSGSGDSGNGGGGGGGGGGTGIRKVTISSIGAGAKGGGNYVVGQTVFIDAGTPPQPGAHSFDKWTASVNSVSFEDATAMSTSFTMPASDVTITANFLNLLGTFTDTRNNKTYKTTVIGGKTWMAENLNYPTSSGSWCYDCDRYGRLYDWNTATTVCPSGWHLPSRGEWDALVSVAGGDNAGKALKSTSGWNNNGNGTDYWGFSALPGGLRYPDGSFYDAGNNGVWWTATEYGSGYAYYRYMYYYYGDSVDEYYGLDKSHGFSVRCVGGD